MKICDLSGAEAEPTAEQSDEPRLKATQGRQTPHTQQRFELAIVPPRPS